MRQTSFQPVVILALNKYDTEYEHKALHDLAWTYKPVIGCYKGLKEDSYVIPFNGPQELQDLLRFASRFNQESILVLDSERKATLQYCNGERISLGTFKATSKSHALKQEAWTYDPTTEAYYICEVS